MKKDNPSLPDQTPSHESESKEPAVLKQPQEYVRKPRRTLPFNEIFSVRTDVDTATLLTHACETLAALNMVTANIADDFTGSQRSRLLAIRQLSIMTEMLVNRAVENLDPVNLVPRTTAPVVH